MSCLVRLPDGRPRLLCKGADSVMLERLEPGAAHAAQASIPHLFLPAIPSRHAPYGPPCPPPHPDSCRLPRHLASRNGPCAFLLCFIPSMTGSRSLASERRCCHSPPQAQAHLDAFARSGLRTLVMASREVSESELAGCLRDDSAARLLLTGREEALEALAARLEARVPAIDRSRGGILLTRECHRRWGCSWWAPARSRTSSRRACPRRSARSRRPASPFGC